MRVFIAGATGVLGRRLVRQLREQGHDVTGLARSDEAVARVQATGARPARASLYDAEALARAAEGAEVVIHAATAIPPAGTPAGPGWAENDRIRREGTITLVDAAKAVGARRYLQQGVVFVVPPGPHPRYDETVTPGPGPLPASSVDGERVALAAAAGGLDVAVLRFGAFYSRDSAHTLATAEMLRQRKLPIVGKGDTIVAPIHADDAAAAMVAAAEGSGTGIWHVVDDHPLPYAEYFRTFAQALGAPAPRQVPVWLARLLAGSATVDFLQTSMDTGNGKFVRDYGWRPRWPDSRDGLREVVREWRQAA